MLVSVFAHFFVQFIYRHVPSTNSIPLLPYSLALYLWPSLLFTPSLCLPLFFSFSSNLCQWSRLKGSVHVWTNPCVSDGFQPQSLLALPCREHPPPPLLLPLSTPVNFARVCVCVHVCEHVFMFCLMRANCCTILLFLFSEIRPSFAPCLTPLFPLSPICPPSLLCTVAMHHDGCCLWFGVASTS